MPCCGERCGGSPTISAHDLPPWGRPLETVCGRPKNVPKYVPNCANLSATGDNRERRIPRKHWGLLCFGLTFNPKRPGSSPGAGTGERPLESITIAEIEERRRSLTGLSNRSKNACLRQRRCGAGAADGCARDGRAAAVWRGTHQIARRITDVEVISELSISWAGCYRIGRRRTRRTHRVDLRQGLQ